MTAFQRWLLRYSQRHPHPALEDHHRQLLAGVRGRVIEIGCGLGALFSRYPATAEDVLAVEPDAESRGQAKRAAENVPVNISVLDGTASALPVETGTADAVVCCEVLCSVADPAEVLAEARRVLRPGGELRVYEHVLAVAMAGRVVQRAADWAIWPRLLGGCHAARDTVTTITEAGFQWQDQQRVWQASTPLTWVTGPHVLGVARS